MAMTPTTSMTPTGPARLSVSSRGVISSALDRDGAVTVTTISVSRAPDPSTVTAISVSRGVISSAFDRDGVVTVSTTVTAISVSRGVIALDREVPPSTVMGPPMMPPTMKKTRMMVQPRWVPTTSP